MKKTIFILLLLLFTTSIYAQTLLSDKVTASLITVGPGNPIYTYWGHSIFRISDPVNDIDQSYNFGVMRMNAPGFMSNFVKGNLIYGVENRPFEYDFYGYTEVGRTLREVELDLTRDQIQALFDYMNWHSTAPNNKYLYLFLHDNCTTRIRDMFDEIPGTVLKVPEIKEKITFRGLVQPYFKNQTWARFGINFIFSSMVDQELTSLDTMGLPDYLEFYFLQATVIDSSGERPLIKNSVSLPLNSNTIIEISTDFWYSPMAIFSLLFFAGVWLTLLKANIKAFDFILFFIVGIAGMLLLFFWLFTNHYYFQHNWNMIWAFPLNIVGAFFVFKKTKVQKYFFRFVFFLIVAVIPISLIVPQRLPLDALPLILLLFLRSFKLGSVSGIFSRLLTYIKSIRSQNDSIKR